MSKTPFDIEEGWTQVKAYLACYPRVPAAFLEEILDELAPPYLPTTDWYWAMEWVLRQEHGWLMVHLDGELQQVVRAPTDWEWFGLGEVEEWRDELAAYVPMMPTVVSAGVGVWHTGVMLENWLDGVSNAGLLVLANTVAFVQSPPWHKQVLGFSGTHGQFVEVAEVAEVPSVDAVVLSP